MFILISLNFFAGLPTEVSLGTKAGQIRLRPAIA